LQNTIETGIIGSAGGVVEWQTRMLQVHVLVRVWGFKSPLPHNQLQSRLGGIFYLRGEYMARRLTKEELQERIDENPLRALANIGEEVGLTRIGIEKLLKSYKLEDYRNQKIKALRRAVARQKRLNK
jgi:hypothetical protein